MGSPPEVSGAITPWERGSVVMMNLEPVLGHEQGGARPVVIVSDTELGAAQRFGTIAIVPLIRTPGQGALYPAIRPGPSGLKHVSYALTDQVRSVDKRRVGQALGAISARELLDVDRGLRHFLGLTRPPPGGAH